MWRPVTLTNLLSVTEGMTPEELIEMLKHLCSERNIDLQKPPLFLPYPGNFSDSEFFWKGDFDIKVIWKGKEDLQRLEAKEKQEPDRPIVFISCGQYAEEEIKLGNDLESIVSSLTPAKGYFAQNQTSLEGVAQNIFLALNNCIGFVAVMHHRGNVTALDAKHIRASVWIEQEIAIASFLTHVDGKKPPVRLYIQKGIKLEGLREKILLNAKEFETSDEVLEDFKTSVQKGQFIEALKQGLL
jgi:hypothetical protein